MNPEQIEAHVKSQIEDAKVQVRDMTGGGDHYEIHVISAKFDGLNLIERHRMMHEVMSDPMKKNLVHAVKFKTLTPNEVN